MGGGFPAAAFGGRADVMRMLSPDGPVYQAGTLSGNPVATTAGLATLRLATDEVYAHIDAAAATLSSAVGEELTRAGVPHVVQAGGNMFSVFLGLDGDSVPDYAEASRQDVGAYKAFFHSMLDAGVYLPPSAYEAWFLSAAHDDRAVQHVIDALPAAAQAAAKVGHVKTTVHLLRHGEVHNPKGILYGRSTGYHLSERGKKMAERVAERIGDRDITHIVSSPLERAQETAAAAGGTGASSRCSSDDRLVESSNIFEGSPFRVRRSILRKPKVWRKLWNPFRPSWGEPYKSIFERMWAAVEDAREAAAGHEAVLVSHQLPIWTLRLKAEGKSFLHDPRKRHCSLCSLTSLIFEDDRLVEVSYSEPAGDLIPVAERNAPFSSGGADADTGPTAEPLA